MRDVPDLLERIVRRRRQRFGTGAPLPMNARARLDPGHPFLSALALPGPSIIAEVKLGSPRLGDLRRRVDPEAQAEIYAAAGARALSVVVEPDHFQGSYELLERCRRASGLPALAKDFVVHPEQIELAAGAGAEAVLLIAALLEGDELRAYADHARSRGLAPLIELHEESELARLEGGSWELVGVNNRDLRTFEVDIERALRMRSALPPGCLAVAESGLSESSEIARLARAGYDAFLVGETLLLADDPGERLRGLLGGDEAGPR